MKKTKKKKKKIADNIIRDVRGLSRLKKEIDDTTIKDIKNLFRLIKEIDDTKDIRIFFRLKSLKIEKRK